MSSERVMPTFYVVYRCRMARDLSLNGSLRICTVGGVGVEGENFQLPDTVSLRNPTDSGERALHTKILWGNFIRT